MNILFGIFDARYALYSPLVEAGGDLVPLAVEEHGPGLEEYLLAVSGARIDVLLYDPPVRQLHRHAVVEQPHHVQLGLDRVYRRSVNKN